MERELEYEMDELIKRIQFLREKALQITPMYKGFSDDNKFVVSLNYGERVLLRTADISEYASKQKEYNILEVLNNRGINISKPLDFGKVEELNICYMILSYIEGEDARALLPTYSEEQQYEIGKVAGQELFRMHQIQAPDTITSWDTRIIPKYKRYLESYKNSGIKIENDENVISFLEEHESILKGRPNVFQHDDFHVGNIIVKDGKYAGAIDVNRYDWGDPIHEFYKVALFSREVSIPFSIGQIKGYFPNECERSDEFWRLYAIYAAMSILSSVVWTQKVTPHLMDDMIKRVYMIMNDHKNFEVLKPVWFK